MMQRFEYLTVYANAKGEYQTSTGIWRNMNHLGDLGWELISVVNDSSELVAFFKRSLPSDNQIIESDRS
ncbi:hypothetical protein [Allocoleopsis franciscana]|uniref:DUF4177 domain-containing protein n=1 Tax=Allocoleopsis franciscana PCC 7113 TaxID=1173027 RepID=K9WBB2_9CYAN|nr:hypothetical protein [Allocoleopsis franciscana]AFZ17665.1 hypothetical protein Mic7113_1808 [Allocoleopsis franciscana PCC 7113]